MKTKITCITISALIVGAMWHFSPLRTNEAAPSVKIIKPLREDARDSVVTNGTIEENNKKSIRLEKTAIIEKLHVSVGDFVSEGSTIIDICEKESELSDISTLSNYFPEVNDISDIEAFYLPANFDEAVELKPEISAPISGIVTDIKVKEGDVALGKLPILTISDFSDLTVRASIPEIYIGKIKLGQKARITSQAVKGKNFYATVKQINPIADKKMSLTGNGETTVDVFLTVDTKNTELKPGYTVNTKIFTATHKQALTIPYTCIFQEGNQEFVYVVNNNMLIKRAVKTGFELDDRVEITNGISENDLIVNNPVDSLEESMIVKVEK